MTETGGYSKMISADSHVVEPMDMWEKALGHKYGDRTPRVIHEYRGVKGDYFYHGAKDEDIFPIRTEEAEKEAEERGLKECGFDPAVRVRFMKEANITAEVLNTTLTLPLFRNPDFELVQACAQVFNDFLAEFVSYDPKRLIGTSVIPMDDVDWAVKELERTTKGGLTTAMINCQAPEGRPPFRDSVYDPFWAAAQEADVPLTLHFRTGRKGIINQAVVHSLTAEEMGEGPGMFVDIFNEIQVVLANDFIFGRILDRFPRLKVICSEFEMAWVPSFMARLDQMMQFGPGLFLPKLEMDASEYVRRRIFHGLIDDPYGQFTIPLIGADQVLWGSDFPHVRSITFEADETVGKLLESLSFEDQEKVVGTNAARVFNLN